MESTVSYDDFSATSGSPCCEEDTEGNMAANLPLSSSLRLVLRINYLKPFFYLVYCVFVVIGNVTTIVVILKLKAKRLTTDIFIMGLAVADLLNAIPLAITYPFIMERNDDKAKMLAYTFSFFNTLSLNVSLIIIFLIAVDR